MRSKYIVIEGLEGAGKTWFSLGNLAVRNLPKS